MGILNKGSDSDSPSPPLKPTDHPEDGQQTSQPSEKPAGFLPTSVVDHAAAEKPLGSPSLPALRLVAVTTGVSLGLFLSMLDSSIVATALVAVAADFSSSSGGGGGGDFAASAAALNWVALAYSLTYLSCSVLFARVSDVVGRRAAFAAAYVVFVAFSLACGFARDMDQLIAFRAVQGAGGAGLYSVSMIILPELTPDHLKKYIAAVVGLVLASAGVLGPVVGGILTQYTNWRWVFWINGPIGGVSLLIFLAAWPDKKYLPALERRAWKDVDFVGAFLLIASAVLIVFPFQHVSSSAAGSHWSSAVFIAPLLAGILCLGALFAWQAFLCLGALFAWQAFLTHRSRDALAMALPPTLLRNRVYAAAVLHTALTGFPYLLCVYAFPVRFQVVYGRGALQAGLMLLPMLAASAAGTALAGAVNGRAGRPVRFAETLAAAAAFMLLGVALEWDAAEAGSGGVLEARVLGFLVFIGFGFGLSAAGSTMLAGVEAPVHEHASAQGIMAQVRIFGGSLGIAASSATLGTKMAAQVAAGGSVATPEMLTHLASDPSSLPPAQWALIRRVYTDALKEDMVVCCAVLGAAMLCGLAVYRRGSVSMEEMMKQRYREETDRRRAAVDVVDVEAGQVP